MNQPFLTAYSTLLVNTCHKRGAFAMGGMAAFVPSKNHDENRKILQKVRDDKLFEINNGHDGTWIAHPGLADYVNEIFKDKFSTFQTNQLDSISDVQISSEQLLQGCNGLSSEECLRSNIRISLKYIEAWISGLGCVAIYGLMEDAATAEISRTSIWQWIKHKINLIMVALLMRDYSKHCYKKSYQMLRMKLESKHLKMENLIWQNLFLKK